MLALRTQPRASPTLSPRLQHAVRLLQMSSTDFAATLRDTLDRNPFLDLVEGAGGDVAETAEDADGGNLGDDSESDSDRDLWLADGPGNRSAHAFDDAAADRMEAVAEDTTLANHLHRQLNLLPLAERDRWLARAVVESLDDDGYLRTPLDELLALMPLVPAPALDELLIALRRVQSLEPAGVGARDVGECLRLQLPAIACPDTRALAERIVTEHLQALAAKDTVGLARRLGRSAACVEAVCDRIRRLDPHPGWRIGQTQTPYLVPDVVVKRVRGLWRAQLNPAVVPRLRLNQVYADLFQRHRKGPGTDVPAMAEHLHEARWTLRNVEQRFATILDVAQAIVGRQRHFLDHGAMAMKPLGLKEIADEVGVHESTVSRVTNNKFMATPAGVFELKHFFSRALRSANGSECSGTAVRSLVKELIDAERSDAPLSDADIARQLAAQGLLLARRTVTKYRQALKIESVARRRRHA